MPPKISSAKKRSFSPGDDDDYDMKLITIDSDNSICLFGAKPFSEPILTFLLR